MKTDLGQIVDNSTIKIANGELYAVLSNLVDNETIFVKDGKLTANNPNSLSAKKEDDKWHT